MKKYLYSLSLLVLLVACNAQSESKAPQGTQEAVTTTEAAPKGIQYVDVPTFKAKIGGENTVLLDVRRPEEVAAGKIEGAMEINVLADDFQQKIEALDKDKTYLVYCKSGIRSTRACKAMEKAGFEDLYSLDGGFRAWSAEQ